MSGIMMIQKKLKKYRHLKQKNDYLNNSLSKKIDSSLIDELNDRDKAYLEHARNIVEERRNTGFTAKEI